MHRLNSDIQSDSRASCNLRNLRRRHVIPRCTVYPILPSLSAPRQSPPPRRISAILHQTKPILLPEKFDLSRDKRVTPRDFSAQRWKWKGNWGIFLFYDETPSNHQRGALMIIAMVVKHANDSGDLPPLGAFRWLIWCDELRFQGNSTIMIENPKTWATVWKNNVIISRWRKYPRPQIVSIYQNTYCVRLSQLKVLLKRGWRKIVDGIQNFRRGRLIL